jgi:amino acid transporter
LRPAEGGRERLGLRRELGLADAVLICTGAIFGADIYIATSFAMAELGPAAVVAWALAGAVAMMMAISMAECSSMFPRAGGPYIYEAAAFGMPVACILSWALWAAEWVALAAFPLAITQYVLFMLPGLGLMELVALRVVCVAVVMAMLYFGIRTTRIVDDAMAAIEKTLLFSFLLMALTLFDSRRFHPFAPHGWQNLGLATIRVFWAYMGFELITMPAEEFKNPERNIPLGITIAMAIITAIYVSTNVILVGSISAEALAGEPAPLVKAALIAAGPVAAAAMMVAAIDSMMASEAGTYLGVTRLAFAMSRDGFAPKPLSYIHERHRTPHVSILVQGVAAMIASNLFTINQLILFSGFTALLSYTATCLAVVALRFKMSYAPRRFKVPLNLKLGGYEVPLIPLAAAAAGCWIMVHAPLEEIIAGLAALAAGLILYLARHLREGLKPSLSGLEIPVLRALSVLGRWATLGEVTSEVFGSYTLNVKQLSSVAATLERLRSRYGRVYVRSVGGEDLWLIRPKLKERERALLAKLKERGWRMKLEEAEGYLKEVERLVDEGVLVREEGWLKLSDEVYADLVE